jgi:hypothetical protein
MKTLSIMIALFALNTSFAAQGELNEFRDKIMSIKEVRYGQRIVFFNHAAVYKLKISSPNYDKYHDVVNEAFEKKKSISIKADPYTMEIIELSK